MNDKAVRILLSEFSDFTNDKATLNFNAFCPRDCVGVSWPVDHDHDCVFWLYILIELKPINLGIAAKILQPNQGTKLQTNGSWEFVLKRGKCKNTEVIQICKRVFRVKSQMITNSIRGNSGIINVDSILHYGFHSKYCRLSCQLDCIISRNILSTRLHRICDVLIVIWKPPVLASNDHKLAQNGSVHQSLHIEKWCN